MNQFTRLEEPTAYTVTLDKPLYKLFRRLETIHSSCKVELYCDEKGQVKSLRVFESHEEVLLRESN